jgi:hypothetical protein
MYEPGLTARKVAVFDPNIFDQAHKLLKGFKWNTKQKRRGDETLLMYLPNSPTYCRLL